MQCADIAVYKAKSQGKNRYVFFRHAMHTDISDRVEIEKQLRSALEKNEFTLYYQPQIDIKTKKIVGFEALLRWSNPMLGLVPPAQFIGIAEETHIIIPIGAWVLRNACLFLKRLQAMGHDDLTVSVNVSIIELVQEDFIDTVSRILELIALPPHCLELEITESVLIESFPVIIDKLYRLKKMGIKIALDDFGKGYSSFNYLKQLPIDTLKIDPVGPS